jgi:hypothetical protein
MHWPSRKKVEHWDVQSFLLTGERLEHLVLDLRNGLSVSVVVSEWENIQYTMYY